MALQPRAAPSVASAPKLGGAGKRWGGAIGLLVLILAACYVGGQSLARRVGDYSPEEIRERMASPEAGLAVVQAIEQVNRLNVAEWREVMRSEEARAYIQRLAPEERLHFVKETLDRGIQDQLQRYHKMSKEERQAFIEQAKKNQREARANMDKLSEKQKEEMRAFAASGSIEELIERALKAYLSLTSSDERAELAPLFDGALENLKYARNLK